MSRWHDHYASRLGSGYYAHINEKYAPFIDLLARPVSREVLPAYVGQRINRYATDGAAKRGRVYRLRLVPGHGGQHDHGGFGASRLVLHGLQHAMGCV